MPSDKSSARSELCQPRVCRAIRCGEGSLRKDKQLSPRMYAGCMKPTTRHGTHVWSTAFREAQLLDHALATRCPVTYYHTTDVRNNP